MNGDKPKVLIIGGGLAGLTAAKRLVDRGFQVRILEKRPIFGGKVSAWKDDEGDWIESGTHCFFGAYDVLYDLMREIGTYHAVLWKEHQLTYTLDGGGSFTFGTWDLPSPLHLLPAIVRNGYFSFGEMAAFARSLVPLALQKQKYAPTQDHLSFAQWAVQRRFGVRLMEKMFRPMALALKFIPPEEISAKIILDVTETFYRLPEASCMGFLKGSPQEYLHQPLVDYSAKRGALFQTGAAVDELLFDGRKIRGVQLRTGEILDADYYLSALPIHNLQKVMPQNLRRCDRFFSNLDRLEGVPVISVQIWYDREITPIDNVLFSPDGLIPVFANLAQTTPEYRALRGEPFAGKSRMEFCVAPARELLGLGNEEIVRMVDRCVRANFPKSSSGAAILKSTVVRIPQSVYAPLPGMEQFRPTQVTPVSNLFLAGGFSQQLFYDSMGGAVMSANLAVDGIVRAQRSKAG